MSYYRLYIDDNNKVIIVQIKKDYEEVVYYELKNFIGTGYYYTEQEAIDARDAIIATALKKLTWRDRLEMASYDYNREKYG